MTEWVSKTNHIKAIVDRDVAVLRIDRPEKLNALTREMRRDLASAIRFFGNGTSVRGLVLTGTGRAFSAGEDLSKTVEEVSEGLEEGVESFHDITRAVLGTAVPMVAALNGLAVGGASEITMCFDRRIGTPNAGYFMPENQIGLVISNASSLLLNRLMKPSDAMALVLGGQRMNADEALSVGLIDEIVPEDKLIDTAVTTILGWTANRNSTAAHLKLLRPDPDRIEAAFARETVLAASVWDSGESQKGIDRFLAAHRSS